MAQKQASKQRASGGGRTSNSEPRVQTFTQFGGCNFQLSPKDFSYSNPTDLAQSDLQMNYLVIQNNADVAPNKTIETRQRIDTIYTSPSTEENLGPACLIGGDLYFATRKKSDGSSAIWRKKVSSDENRRSSVTLYDEGKAKQSIDRTFTEIGYAADSLVALTKEGELWTSQDLASIADYKDRIANAIEIPAPKEFTADNFSEHVIAKGDLKVSKNATDDCPFRVGIQWTYVNKYGPTLPTSIYTFYASKPTTEWSSAGYVTIKGYSLSGTNYGIKAVELYYIEDEYQEANFLARVEVDGKSAWTFNWLGYLADTSMWTTANITVPKQNYTKGVPASHFTQHDGRLYFWGNPAEPQRLWIGGNPGNVFSVSTGVGGGFVDVEPGNGQEIRMVPKYKTQSGNSIVTILCDNKNSSHEHRHNLLENNISLSSEQTVKGWQTEKVNGTVGCKSFHGAGVWADGLYAISRYGLALTTMTMEYNSQLRVQYVSDPIEPVFLDQYGSQLKNSVLLSVNDVLYMCFGSENEGLDNVIFCYDIDMKAWWTYSLDIDEPILNMINIDYEGFQEGIGIITKSHIYFLPTTRTTRANTVEFLLETGELATAQPQQAMQHLTQLEFRFDYFVGDMKVTLTCIDQFGRKITTIKTISHDEMQYGLAEYMRVDLRVKSYKLTFSGDASFRMTHFMAKTYPLPSRIGTVWGFDDSQGNNSDTDIHRYFRCYNDLKKAIIP